jgi:hypothetical protein
MAMNKKGAVLDGSGKKGTHFYMALGRKEGSLQWEYCGSLQS